LHRGQPGGDTVQERHEPDGFANRDKERGAGLDVDVGAVDRIRLDTATLSLFPPLPGDLAEWGETLEQSPGIKPCVYGLDDGVAFGLDRSSSAGNGVVSLAAAYAFRTLKDALLS